MIVKLVRLTTGKQTFGNIIVDNQPICLTLEPPWNDNQRDISCIPDGIYQCKRIISTTKNTQVNGVAYEILDVPNRDNILIHIGNWVTETKGCILVGTYYSKDMVCLSEIAMRKLLAILPDVFTMEITNAHI